MLLMDPLAIGKWIYCPKYLRMTCLQFNNDESELDEMHYYELMDKSNLKRENYLMRNVNQIIGLRMSYSFLLENCHFNFY